MTFLLDTHCWLWLKFDASRLPSPVRRRVLRNPRELVLSSVCVMEMVIKQAAGKLTLGCWWRTDLLGCGRTAVAIVPYHRKAVLAAWADRRPCRPFATAPSR